MVATNPRCGRGAAATRRAPVRRRGPPRPPAVPPARRLAHPGLLRLYAQEVHQPGSPLGVLFRQLREEVRQDLADDLLRLGLPAAESTDREQVDMIADAMIAQTEALALGYLDGRYTSLDAVVEVLTRFAVGMLGGAIDTPPPASPRVAPG